MRWRSGGMMVEGYTGRVGVAKLVRALSTVCGAR